MLGKFQTREYLSWKGLTSENHYGALFRSAPQKATDVMIEFLAFQKGKNLESYLAKLPVKYFDSDEEYTWEAAGISHKNIPIIEARDLAGNIIGENDMAGVGGGTRFYVVFGEDYFGLGEVIVGEKNELYPLRIVHIALEGTNAVYTVELMGGVTEGMPGSELQLGKRFSYEYAPVERSFSKGVGAVRYASNISMRNEWSTIRLKDEIPGNAFEKKMLMGIPVIDKDGKKTVITRWAHLQDYKFEETFREYKANLLAFGRSNRNQNGEYLNIGVSGTVIKMGAGLFEQMEYGNTEYYSDTNQVLKIIEDSVSELCVGKIPVSERKVVIRTGERGTAIFHKGVLNQVNGWQIMNFTQNPGVISKVSSPLHSNALSAGFQFVEYKAPNGVVLTLEIEPLYSDPVRNKILHPLGGTAMEYCFDIVNMGSTEVPNIQLARLNGQEEMRGMRSGMRNPYTGALNNPYMSFEDDKAEMHKQATLGVFILDTTRVKRILPSILA